MKLLFNFIFIISITSVSISQQPPNNMHLLGNFNEYSLPPHFNAPWSYAAIWGYQSPDNREYAVLGCALGTVFYDVTDSANIQEVGFFPNVIDTVNPDQGVLWQEMKVYSHYAYVVSEADTSGVKIYDLQYLPDSVVYVKKFFAAGHRSTHSISQEGPYLYLNGSNSSFGNGTAVLDLSQDPVNPVLRGKWNTRYVHDCRVLNDTIFAMNINQGDGQITVIDARNKDSLKTITQWFNLPNPAPHNNALTSGRDYLYATDEVGPLPRLLKVWDIRDLSNIVQVNTWQPTGITTSIVHNVEIYGDTAVIAHYTAGVRVLDISNPVMPVEIGWYDTYPANNNNLYQGCWGVYKLPSGKIIASDMNTGLYVLKMGKTVGINNNVIQLNEFRLEQNFPNPFNPVTTISYELKNSGNVEIKIFDALGREVRQLLNEKRSAGVYTLNFNADGLAGGVYFYSMNVTGINGNESLFKETKKMIVLK